MAGTLASNSMATCHWSISRHSPERISESSQGRDRETVEDDARAHTEEERESHARIDFSVGLGNRPISLQDVMAPPPASRWARTPLPRQPPPTIAVHQERRGVPPEEILNTALDRVLDILSEGLDNLFDE